MFSLILGSIIGLISLIFALQNVFSVTVTFFTWDITASLSLVVLVSIVSGFIVATLLYLPQKIKSAFTISKLKRENKKIQKELDLLKKKEEEA